MFSLRLHCMQAWGESRGNHKIQLGVLLALVHCPSVFYLSFMLFGSSLCLLRCLGALVRWDGMGGVGHKTPMQYTLLSTR